MIGLCFSAAKEYTRNITGTESPVNSAVGGAAAGGLLFASHGGNPVLGAAVVAALAALTDTVLGPTLKGMDTEDPGATTLLEGAGDGGRPASWWSLDRWVRKTSEEERLEFLEKVRRRRYCLHSLYGPRSAVHRVGLVGSAVSPHLTRWPQKYSDGDGLPGKSDRISFNWNSIPISCLHCAQPGGGGHGGGARLLASLTVGTGIGEDVGSARWQRRSRYRLETFGKW